VGEDCASNHILVGIHKTAIVTSMVNAMTSFKCKSIPATLVATSLVLSVALSPVMTSASIAEIPATRTLGADTIDQAIERFIIILDRASNRPVGRIGGLLLQGYAAYKQWQNGREIAGIREVVYDMLSEIAGLVDRIERGETISDAQWTLAREDLDNHAARMVGIESRLDRVERSLGETKREVDEITKKVTRKPCLKFHKPVGPAKTCVDVRTIRTQLSN
jgi:hypothetical protein